MASTHLLLIGRTKSGKTQVARRLAQSVGRRGTGVIVHDPIAPRSGRGAGGWAADHVCTSWPEFVSTFWASANCLAIIDEAGGVCAAHQDRLEMRRMVQRGRHQGHVIALISQRHTDIDKTAREQCDTGYFFRISSTDAASLADEWCAPELAQCHELPPLHYWHARLDGSSPRRGVLTF